MEKGKCQLLECTKMGSLRCSHCKISLYCSKEHQKCDWHTHKVSCNKKKFQLEEIETYGRGLVATEEIKADYILFKEKPIMIAPKLLSEIDFCGPSSTTPICLGCYKELEDDDDKLAIEKNCFLCGLPCHNECSDQYFHKNFECKLFSEAKEANGNLIIDADVKSSFLATLIYYRCILLKIVNSKYWDELMNLQSNAEIRQDVPNLEKTTRIYEDMTRVLETIAHPTLVNVVYKPDLHKIIGILDINALNEDIRLSLNSEVVVIFPLFSMVNHSCTPNIKYYFVPQSGKKGPLELYCRSAVKLNKGEQLATSYVNLLWNTDKRREYLKKHKNFWCRCMRCMDSYELGSNFSTLVCPICKSPCVPVQKSPETAPEEIHWKCSSQSCLKTCAAYQVKKVETKLAELISRTVATVQNYESVLEQVEELVHPNFYLNFVLNHSLIQMYATEPKTLEAKLTLCNRMIEIIKIIDPGLAKLHLFASVVYYEIHSSILGMVGGEVDDDYKILRQQPQAVNLAKVYLQKCVDCFQYEFIESPEYKLKLLALKKLQYLNLIMSKR